MRHPLGVVVSAPEQRGGMGEQLHQQDKCTVWLWPEHIDIRSPDRIGLDTYGASLSHDQEILCQYTQATATQCTCPADVADPHAFVLLPRGYVIKRAAPELPPCRRQRLIVAATRLYKHEQRSA